MYCLNTADNKLFNNQTARKECLVEREEGGKDKTVQNLYLHLSAKKQSTNAKGE